MRYKGLISYGIPTFFISSIIFAIYWVSVERPSNEKRIWHELRRLDLIYGDSEDFVAKGVSVVK